MKRTLKKSHFNLKDCISSKIAALVALSFLVTACSGDDDNSSPTAPLILDIIGLERLGESSEYEAWLVVDGENRSLGRFINVDFPKTFNVDADALSRASAFKLSIEPGNDPSQDISKTVLLSGVFSGNAATLDISETLGNFFNASGKFVLQTPTDDIADNDESGIYWYDPQVDGPGLQLPTLPEGWKYEGWVTVPTNQGNVNLSTGTFRSPFVKDDFTPYSFTTNPAPPFPGEDFLNLNLLSQSGVNNRPDLRGKSVFITIEPSPDNDGSEPFLLRPLTGKAGLEVSPAINFMDLNRASFPIGTANR